MTSVESVPVTSSMTALVSTGVDTAVTTDESAVDVTVTDVDSTQGVAVTSSVGGTSSLLAQLSYAQPSIELLRRRRAADTSAASSDTATVSMPTPGPTHLLSSATQAALAALASTPRRYITAISICTVYFLFSVLFYEDIDFLYPMYYFFMDFYFADESCGSIAFICVCLCVYMSVYLHEGTKTTETTITKLTIGIVHHESWRDSPS